MKHRSSPAARLSSLFLLFLLISGSNFRSFPFDTISREAAPLKTVTLQLKWTHQYQFAGYYAALEKGYYKQAGLDVRIVEGSSTIDPIQQVMQGRADFGATSSDLVLWKARGFPVVSLAAIFQHSPMVILANPKNGVVNIHALAGKTLGMESQSAEVLAYLKSENLPLKDVTILPYSFSPESFADGSIDATSAYLTDEPYELASRNIEYYVLNPRSSGVDFYGDCLFTSQSIIKNDPALVKAFVKASLLGWQYALANTGEMVDIILDRYHSTHTRDHLVFEAEQSRGLIMPDVVELGYQNPGRWMRIAETYEELGQFSGTIDLTSFVYEINPPPNLTGLYAMLAGFFGVMVVAALIASRFYRLNTAIKQQMAQREEAENSLRQMELRYRTLVENAPFPIIISSLTDGVYRYINQQAASLFDITSEFAVGRPASFLYENPEDRQILIDRLNASGYIKNWEVRLKKSSGECFWANVSATRIPFDGENAIFVGLIDITERKELERKLVELARYDSLTGLFSRGYFLEMAATEVQRCVRYHSPLALLMLDVDYFKKVNDNFGHAAGDSVLVELSAMMKKHTRNSDLFGRLGGEEFSILLTNTNQEAALIFAERLRQEVEQMIVSSGGGSIHVTISIGITSLRPRVETLEQLLKAADSALYEAKRGGRNRVCEYLFPEE